jgi:hypothetical protein
MFGSESSSWNYPGVTADGFDLCSDVADKKIPDSLSSLWGTEVKQHMHIGLTVLSGTTTEFSVFNTTEIQVVSYVGYLISYWNSGYWERIVIHTKVLTEIIQTEQAYTVFRWTFP